MPSSRFVGFIYLSISETGRPADEDEQETLNFWKQLAHVMKYFRPEEDPGARLPPNFITGFLEGRN